jgi:hypothetical protein
MSSNGGFPPLKIIKKEIKQDLNKKSQKKERFYKHNIVTINNIIHEVKKPMIEMDKDDIKIIDIF